MSKKSTTFNAVPLAGSHRGAEPGKRLRPVHGNTQLDVSIQFPTAGSAADIHYAITCPQILPDRKLRKIFGAKTSHVQKAIKTATACGLKIEERTLGHKMFGVLHLSGRYTCMQKFFPGLDLGVYEVKVKKQKHEIVARVGSINVIDGLNIVGVYGMDEREVAHTNFRMGDPTETSELAVGHSPRRGRKPHPVDDGGTFPTNLTARGQAKVRGIPVDQLMNLTTVVTGYESLGGDNGKKMQKDLALAAAFDGIKLNAGGMVGVNVDGTKLDGDYTDESTVENILDALQHRLKNPNGHCLVFATGNNDNSFALGAETAVAYPGLKVGNKTLPLLAFSISWGMAESNNTPQTLQRWGRIYLAGRAKGLIMTAATGDNGSTDNTDKDTPDSPASTANCFGAAGVYIKVDANGKIVEIGVWNDLAAGGGATGGGISATFPVQDYEKGLTIPVSGSTGAAGHSASTLAGIAAPACGPLVWWNGSAQTKGKPFPVGGTSNAAPETAIDMALIQSQLKNRIKDMIGFVYTNFAAITDPITVPGDNGDPTYKAGPGVVYSVSTGFGMINWTKFLAVAKKIQDGVGA